MAKLTEVIKRMSEDDESIDREIELLDINVQTNAFIKQLVLLAQMTTKELKGQKEAIEQLAVDGDLKAQNLLRSMRSETEETYKKLLRNQQVSNEEAEDMVNSLNSMKDLLESSDSKLYKILMETQETNNELADQDVQAERLRAGLAALNRSMEENNVTDKEMLRTLKYMDKVGAKAQEKESGGLMSMLPLLLALGPLVSALPGGIAAALVGTLVPALASALASALGLGALTRSILRLGKTITGLKNLIPKWLRPKDVDAPGKKTPPKKKPKPKPKPKPQPKPKPKPKPVKPTKVAPEDEVKPSKKPAQPKQMKRQPAVKPRIDPKDAIKPEDLPKRQPAPSPKPTPAPEKKSMWRRGWDWTKKKYDQGKKYISKKVDQVTGKAKKFTGRLAGVKNKIATNPIVTKYGAKGLQALRLLGSVLTLVQAGKSFHDAWTVATGGVDPEARDIAAEILGKDTLEITDLERSQAAAIHVANNFLGGVFGTDSIKNFGEALGEFIADPLQGQDVKSLKEATSMAWENAKVTASAFKMGLDTAKEYWSNTGFGKWVSGTYKRWTGTKEEMASGESTMTGGGLSKPNVVSSGLPGFDMGGGSAYDATRQAIFSNEATQAQATKLSHAIYGASNFSIGRSQFDIGQRADVFRKVGFSESEIAKMKQIGTKIRKAGSKSAMNKEERSFISAMEKKLQDNAGLLAEMDEQQVQANLSSVDKAIADHFTTKGYEVTPLARAQLADMANQFGFSFLTVPHPHTREPMFLTKRLLDIASDDKVVNSSDVKKLRFETIYSQSQAGARDMNRRQKNVEIAFGKAGGGGAGGSFQMASSQGTTSPQPTNMGVKTKKNITQSPTQSGGSVVVMPSPTQQPVNTSAGGNTVKKKVASNSETIHIVSMGGSD
jgi:hypothetical protein